MAQSLSPVNAVSQVATELAGMSPDNMINELSQYIGPGEALNLGKAYVAGAIGDDFIRKILERFRKKPKPRPSGFNPKPTNPNKPSLKDVDPNAPKKDLGWDTKVDDVPPLETMDDYYERKFAPKMEDLEAQRKANEAARKKKQADFADWSDEEFKLSNLNEFVRKPK
jgi:hypothetical protein